jgi:RNA polymerase sigma-70 factor (ECF subfamily)
MPLIRASRDCVRVLPPPHTSREQLLIEDRRLGRGSEFVFKYFDFRKDLVFEFGHIRLHGFFLSQLEALATLSWLYVYARRDAKKPHRMKIFSIIATVTSRPSSSSDITRWLIDWSSGDDDALEKLTPLVYEELRRIARRYMAAENPGHTLQASALVNEAFLKLVDTRRIQWRNRAHFFAISARLMRRILVDSARRKHYLKRGGRAGKVTFDENLIVSNDRSRDVIALDEALKTLAEMNPRVSHVVELRYFGGLTEEETAEALQISSDTVLRDWRFAKAWLHRELSRENPE